MNIWIRISGILGALAVIGGAFAAHLLKGKLDERALDWIKTASYYQMVHALALLGWASLGISRPTAQSTRIGWAFALGTLLFSGSLYAMAFGAPSVLGAVTPIGGGLLILGWVLLARIRFN